MGGAAGWSWAGASGAEALLNVAAASAPFWLLLGGLIGLLLPRPKWMDASGRTGALLYYTPPGLFVRRAVMVFHGAYLLRDIWNYFTLPGASQGFLHALWSALCGRGFVLPQPAPAAVVAVKGTRTHKHARGQQKHHAPDELKWYVDESDLEFFKDRVEREAPLAGAGPWEQMMERDFGAFTYCAWRRSLPNGKTEYKSVTVALDATAEEFMDFYLDDRVRPNWDSMISETGVLEHGPASERCQVVRYVRSFPFSFLSKREYVIARRLFREQGCLYGITKGGLEHPRAPLTPDIVRMDGYYSMWRSRTVPCPRGGGAPACETVLLHHEQFKIPEHLARFAVRAGMAGFVKKMGPEVRAFVAARRARCDPFEADADAFGARELPNPPLQPSASGSSLASLDSLAPSALAARPPAEQQRAPRRRRAELLRKALEVAAVSAAAVLLERRRARV